MRSLMIALVVGLLVAPSFGLINVALTASNLTPMPADVITITVSGQGSAAGLYALGVNSVASTSDGGVLTTVGPGTWVAAMIPPNPFTTKNGVVAANGGLSQIGSEQVNYLSPDPTYALNSLVPVFSYQVTVGNTPGSHVTLSLTTGTYGGYKCAETNKATAIGALTPVTITIMPEPVTMALLAIGGLLVARRRR